MENQIVLGVDIGGSHITAMLVNLKTGKPVKSSEAREPLITQESANEIISFWSNVIQRAFDSQVLGSEKIGIAIPGPFDYYRGIALMRNQNKYDSLYGLNIKELLAKTLKIPSHNIRFLNDAESFLKGETLFGAAKGLSKVIGLTLGTGLGSATFFNGNFKDADLWHSPFLQGIAEDYLSTRWFIANYFKLSGKKVKGVKELAVLATEDIYALETFKEFGCNLSLFIKDIVEKHEPEIIVIGGNIANAFSLFKEAVHEQLALLPNRPLIKKAILGEDASVIGAACCWVQVEEYLEQFS
jgi:glucokinase